MKEGDAGARLAGFRFDSAFLFGWAPAGELMITAKNKMENNTLIPDL
jgi:hypothetical protein